MIQDGADVAAAMPIVDLGWLQDVVEKSDQAAVVWDDTGAVIYANEMAKPILVYIERVESYKLHNVLLVCQQQQRPVSERISVPAGNNYLFYDITALPANTAKGLHILLVGRDSTMEHNFSNALVASRRLFKDLVSCSSDFAWETNAQGAFTYVSQNGAIGYTAVELNGKLGRNLIHQIGVEVRPNPFESHVELTDEEILLMGPQGQSVVMRVSSLPVHDEDGGWNGARGVCRDITEQKTQELALQQSQERERLSQRVVDAIHNELTPDAMVTTAANALAEAMNVPYCWILRADAQNDLKLVAQVGDDVPLSAEISDIVGAAATNQDEHYFEAERDDLRMMIVRCGHKNANKGYAVAARHQDMKNWTNDERVLISSVASHVGVAIAQAQAQERLVWLSRTDELTGLFNRRAFDDEVTI